MNILAIASIMPIPDHLRINDFLIHIYKAYKKKYPDDNIIIIRPVRISFLSKRIKNVHKLTDIEIESFKVYVFKYFSSQRMHNTHSLITRTIYFFNKKKLKKIIKKENIDICHAQYIYPDGLLALKIKKKYNLPYIITTHNELFYFKRPVSALTGKKILKNASVVAPLNYNSYNYYTQKKKLANVKVTPLGFYDSLLKIRKKYSAEEKVKILSICELIKLKNIDKVILALSEIDTKKYSYTIVGRGPEKSNLESLVQSLGLEKNIQFIESVPHKKIGETIGEHEVFIMPSYYETFGRVFVESMAVGLPIICARNSGIYGYYKEQEEGLTVDHNDISDIKNKLELLINNNTLREKIGKNGKNLVKDFTWDKIAEKYNKLFKESLV